MEFRGVLTLRRFSETEIPFVLRCIVQALGVPELADEALGIMTSLHGGVPNATPDALDTSEPCPACHIPILFTDPTLAVCPNGHKWRKRFPIISPI